MVVRWRSVVGWAGGESAGGVGQSDGFAGPLGAEAEGVALVGQHAARADRASGVLGGGEQVVGVDGGGGFGRPAHPRPGRGRGAYGAERLVGAVVVVGRRGSSFRTIWTAGRVSDCG